MHEQVLRHSVEEVIAYYQKQQPRGEYVLVIEGKSHEDIVKENRKAWMMMDLEEHMAYYEAQGIGRKDAMKMVAKDRGVSKRDVYRELLD